MNSFKDCWVVERILFLVLLLSVFAGCSSGPIGPEIGPAQRAGRYLDNAWERTKRGSAYSYDKSKEWVRTTSDRFSRGVSGFGQGWRGERGQERPERDIYSRDVDSSYDYPEDRHDYEYAGRGRPDSGPDVDRTPDRKATQVDSGDGRY
jgi:hypothetical protein